jgi:toxin YoeB
MAKRLIWSPRAQNDRKEILKFWREKNKSNAYSKKLDSRFREATKIIKDFPHISTKIYLRADKLVPR